ncbi:phosphoribosylamine--glycine ligase [Compostibacter hankyongensis]|uniref:Phosphoribosylamine--glycine ligase n=1 Tax=Compostibacter hankyongensis TaxID=1007089 RepID=A0ABP8FED5_9BACT
MNILLLGSGGREHALAWKLRQSPDCGALYIAPGNAGTAGCGTNVPIAVHDFERLAAFCLEHDIQLLIPGSEEPLVAGIYDYFGEREALRAIQVIGPSREGARLEGSKAFAKAFMERHGIPTAAYREFTAEDYEAGKQYLREHALPVVLKADGLAAGKGVVICDTHEAALEVFGQMLQEARFGEAGKKVVVEAFLSGIELSVFVLTDGRSYVLLPEAKDYKRIGAGDTGPNTGGMGAVSPVPFADAAFMERVENRIIRPTIAGLAAENIDYKGFIFFGLIKVGEEPFVIEYNCRMGDPETEVVMPRLEADLLALLSAVKTGRLSEVPVSFEKRTAATVMLVSGGYPGGYDKGKTITGLDQVRDSRVFHAGTRAEGDTVVTNGGRVLAITSLAGDLKTALERSNACAAQICFDKKYFRSDIGWEFL